jgi:TetR/AcrR family transcriptional regulator, regulator of cefoperazone and chloramphenicol sensitivity
MTKRGLIKTRRRARGPREDGALTRAQLLEAAGVVFAEKGFDGATAKEIAEKAGTNAAAVNYHFGGIDRLYQEVLVAAHNRMVSLQQIQAIVSDGLSPEEKLRRLMGIIVGVFTEPDSASWAIRVIGREVLAPSPHTLILRQQAFEPKKALVFALVAELLNLPADHPAVGRCFFNIAAPSAMLMLADRELISELLPTAGKHGAEALADHLVRFALGGIAAVAKAERSRKRSTKR